MGNWIHFGAQRCQKYALHQKKFKEKLFGVEFVQKSPRVHMFISPMSGGGL